MPSLEVTSELINEALKYVEGYISGQFPYQKQTIRGMVDLLFQASQQQQYSTVLVDQQLHRLCDYCLAHSLDPFESSVIQAYLYTYKRDQPYSALQSLYQASTHPIPRIATAYTYTELYITLFNHLFTHYQYEMIKMQFPILTLIYDDPTDRSQGESFQFDLVRFRSTPYVLPLDQDIYSNTILYARYQQQKLSQAQAGSPSNAMDSPLYDSNGSSSGQLSSTSSSSLKTQPPLAKSTSVQATPSIRNNPTANPHLSTPQGKKSSNPSSQPFHRLYESQNGSGSHSATKTPQGPRGDKNANLPTHFEGDLDDFQLNENDEYFDENGENDQLYSQYNTEQPQSRSLLQQNQPQHRQPLSTSTSSSASQKTPVMKTNEELEAEKEHIKSQLEYAQSLRDSSILKLIVGMGALGLSTLFVLQRDFKEYLYPEYVPLEPQYEIQITPDGRRRRRKIPGRQSVHDLNREKQQGVE